MNIVSQDSWNATWSISEPSASPECFNNTNLLGQEEDTSQIMSK
jgi:hypothetical protein